MSDGYTRRAVWVPHTIMGKKGATEALLPFTRSKHAWALYIRSSR